MRDDRATIRIDAATRPAEPFFSLTRSREFQRVVARTPKARLTAGSLQRLEAVSRTRCYRSFLLLRSSRNPDRRGGGRAASRSAFFRPADLGSRERDGFRPY